MLKKCEKIIIRKRIVKISSPALQCDWDDIHCRFYESTFSDDGIDLVFSALTQNTTLTHLRYVALCHLNCHLLHLNVYLLEWVRIVLIGINTPPIEC